MTPVAELMLTKAEFLRWIEAPERRRQRFEWAEGKVVQQANVTLNHGIIAGNIHYLFLSLLDREVWCAFISDVYVEQNGSYRLPDVIVTRLGADGKRRSVTEPVVLVEVLSSTSVERDFHDKLAEYPGFASLEAYIIASQDEPKCWLWERGKSGTFAERPRISQGRADSIVLGQRGIELPLAEIYRSTDV